MIDAGSGRDPERKPDDVKAATQILFPQARLRHNPDARIAVTEPSVHPLLERYAISPNGMHGGDTPRFRHQFWEHDIPDGNWVLFQHTVVNTSAFAGREHVFFWPDEGRMHTSNPAARIQGDEAWGKEGVAVSMMRGLPVTRYTGEKFDISCTPIVPKDARHLPAIWVFCSSIEFSNSIRKIDKKVNVTNATMVKVPFYLDHWQKVATEIFPNGLPAPYSDDPTQWVFHGHPAHAAPGTQLSVALARLAGYRWPAEADTTMRLAPEARNLIARAAALPPTSVDGLLTLHAQESAPALADRLRAFLAAAFGSRWSNALEADLVREADAALDKKSARDATLDTWLWERAFRQHCTLFRDRPFLWQVTDGMREGFSAFMHYHRLDYAKLEKLTYTALGDWLARARDGGQTARAERARALQQKLEAILEGEKPYDIFVRWKPLAAQPMGWNPDFDDGVRQNIRPFIKAGVLTHDLSKILKDKDRGADPPMAPWYANFNGERRTNHHTSLAEKRAAGEQR